MSYRIIPVTRFAQNCSLWICDATHRAVVIDPGGDIDRILDAAQNAGATIERLLITHGHFDHAGAGRMLSHRLGVPIEGPHQADEFLFADMPDQMLKYHCSPCERFVPDRWLTHGQTVGFGEQRIEVLHCPGHTPGHVAYFHRAWNLLAVGDILFAGSIGATIASYCSRPQLIRSIRERLFPLGDQVRFIPGHGKLSTLGWEREINPFVADYLHT